jgi:hypothetical protein
MNRNDSDNYIYGTNRCICNDGDDKSNDTPMNMYYISDNDLESNFYLNMKENENTYDYAYRIIIISFNFLYAYCDYCVDHYMI